MDTKPINTSLNTEASAAEKADPTTVSSRRDFVQRSGKALYLIPTLTLLGSATASAQNSCPGGPLCGAPEPDEAPAPTE